MSEKIKIICPTCKGAGEILANDLKNNIKCSTCNGKGYLEGELYIEPNLTLLENPNWDEVIEASKNIFQKMLNKTYRVSDGEDVYIFVLVMKALYGENFWKWYNNENK